MSDEGHQFILHFTVARHATLAMDIYLARSIGFDGIEASGLKLKTFFEHGGTPAELRETMAGISVPGLGYLADIERHGADEATLMRDAEELFAFAGTIGARGVQVLTGPLDVRAVIDHASGVEPRLYAGLLGLPREEQMAITAANLARLADRASEAGLLLYLESLAWTPLNRLADQLAIIDRAGRDNVRLVIDYWHCNAVGDTPDDVARIDGNLIYGVHICDSLPVGDGIPDEAVSRDVATGAGVIDLRHWTDAVKSTGYVGWWSGELFCRRQHRGDSHAVASELHALMKSLVLG